MSFVEAPGDRGTEIHVDLEGSAPAGKLGEVAQKLVGSEPRSKVMDDLRRFKQHVETGVIARSDGTPEGELAERKLKQRPAQPLDESGEVRTAAAIHAGYSLLTDYPLGIVKVIPFKAHLVLDAVGALALATTPFVTGQYKKGSKQWVPHVGLAVFELASLAMTDPTGKGDFHGDIEAVREANTGTPTARSTTGPRREARRGLTSGGSSSSAATAAAGL